MAGENGIDLRHASPNLPAPGGHYSHMAARLPGGALT